jgi:DNA-binding helix-hairpin-helix protein with protein kinase domain
MTDLRCSKGPLQLGQVLARGGEGVVYTVAHEPALVAKLYVPGPRDGYSEKLSHMVANPPADPSSSIGHASIAWPVDLIADGKGRVVGYLMPRITDAVKVLTVFNPRLRSRTLPNFDSRYLHRSARNLAAAVTAVHARGYVVGDLNESNVLLTRQALVTLIDTDSFQVEVQQNGVRRLYSCPVGKPEYTPPELQGKSFERQARTPSHDAFALGVLVFQLLMEGNHPFRSRWLGPGEPPDIAEKIRQGLFPYGQVNRALVRAPSGLSLDLLHPKVAELVVRCFGSGHSAPTSRPSPSEWEQALGEAEQTLVQCANGHFRQQRALQCPYCARAQVQHRITPPVAASTASWPLCRHCARPNLASEIYCQHCGAQLVPNQPCPTCGKDMPQSAPHCPHCGSLATVVARPKSWLGSLLGP